VWKTEKKLTSNKWICSEVTLNSLWFHVVSPEEERKAAEGFAEKEGFKPGTE